MSVVRSVQETGAHRKELQIEVPEVALKAETERIVAEYRRNVGLPGFRKGKAPKSLVEKRFGKEIDQEVLDRLVPRYCHQAISESELEPLMNPRVSNVEHTSGESLSFVATVEYRPELEIAGIDALKLPDPDCEPHQHEVDEALEKLRRDVAPWKEVERVGSQGDLATVRIRELGPEGDDEEASAQPEQTVPFELGDANVWEELSLAATGLSAGQSSEFERTEPAPPGAEGEVQSSPAKRRFNVSVDSVSEKDLPELDDAMAAKVGKFESLEALQTEIRSQLRTNKEQERGRARESAALEQLAEANPIELPEGVMQHETETLLREYAENLASRGVDLETAELDWARLRDELTPQAQRRVHSRLILDAVARERDMKVPDEELEQALISIARAQRVSTAELRSGFENDGRMDALREDLLRRKAVRALTGEEIEEASTAENPSGDAASTDDD